MAAECNQAFTGAHLDANSETHREAQAGHVLCLIRSGSLGVLVPSDGQQQLEAGESGERRSELAWSEKEKAPPLGGGPIAVSSLLK